MAVIRDQKGFRLVERGSGRHSCDVDYQLIVRPKTNHGEGRFPMAAPPDYVPRDMDPAAAKTKNRPGRTRVVQWKADCKVFPYDPADLTPPGREVDAGPKRGLIRVDSETFATKEECRRSHEKGRGPPPLHNK